MPKFYISISNKDAQIFDAMKRQWVLDKMYLDQSHVDRANRQIVRFSHNGEYAVWYVHQWQLRRTFIQQKDWANIEFAASYVEVMQSGYGLHETFPFESASFNSYMTTRFDMYYSDLVRKTFTQIIF